MKFIKVKHYNINAECICFFEVIEDMPDLKSKGSEKESFTFRFFFGGEEDPFEVDFYKSRPEDMKELEMATDRMMALKMFSKEPEYMERFKVKS